MSAATTAGPRRRRSTVIRKSESTECSLTPGDKRRLQAFCEANGISEADAVRPLVLALLDEAGIVDPGEPADGQPVELAVA